MGKVKKVAEDPKAAGTSANAAQSKKKGKKEAVKEPSVEKKIAKKKKKNYSRYDRFIYKILKQTHNELGMSKKSMDIFNSFVINMIDKIVKESGSLIRIRNGASFSESEIRTAIRFLLPGELYTFAKNEGEKALTRYKASIANEKQKKKEAAKGERQRETEEEESVEEEEEIEEETGEDGEIEDESSDEEE